MRRESDSGGRTNEDAWAPGPHEHAAWRERVHLVRRLRVRQQRILWLKAIGSSYEEIAAQEEESPGARQSSTRRMNDYRQPRQPGRTPSVRTTQVGSAPSGRARR
jgi:hypothetical protein